MPRERERTKPTPQLHAQALGRPLIQCSVTRASDPDGPGRRHLSPAPVLCLARILQVLSKGGWRLAWGVSLLSPLPLLLPKQLTSSDVVLWLHSRQPAHVDMVYFQFLTVSHVDFLLGSKSDPCTKGLYD